MGVSILVLFLLIFTISSGENKPAPSAPLEKKYTERDLRNAECAVGCKRSGYFGGTSTNNKQKCFCYDEMDYNILTDKKMRIPQERLGYSQYEY